MEKNDVRLWKHNLRKRLWHRLAKQCFDFPVVYTDGLVSRCKNDREGRTPWGVVFDGCLVPVRDAPVKMQPRAGAEYCRSVSFAGCRGSVPSFQWLEKVNRKVNLFNCHRTVLGGEALKVDYYLSNSANHNVGYDVVKMTGQNSRTVYYAGYEDSICILPVIELSQLTR